MGIKQIANGRADMFFVPASVLAVIEDEDFRTAEEISEQVEKLTESMRCMGFDKTQPIAVFPLGNDVFSVINGRCRLRAAQAAGIDSIPVVCADKGLTRRERIAFSMRANTAKEFSPLAQARLFGALQSEGMTNTDIAKECGVTLPHVANMLSLSQASAEVIAMVEAGEVSATTAALTIKEVGAEAASVAITEAVAVAKRSGKAKASGTIVRAVLAGGEAAPVVLEVVPVVLEVVPESPVGVETTPAENETILEVVPEVDATPAVSEVVPESPVGVKTAPAEIEASPVAVSSAALMERALGDVQEILYHTTLDNEHPEDILNVIAQICRDFLKLAGVNPAY